MIVLDANILIRASNEGDPDHKKIKRWVEEAFNNQDLIIIPWVSVWAFLRVTTNPRLFATPIPLRRAFEVVRAWASLPNVSLAGPGSRHLDLLESMATQGQAGGPLISDAAIAAIAIEQGSPLASTDRDLLRFPGLKVLNPLG